jgi:hypothetical protein
MDSDVGNMQTDVVDANALATDAANEIRDAILADSTPFNGANIDQSLSTTESNIRGVDGDTLKTLSDQLDDISGYTLAAATTAAAGSTATEVRTGLTQADDFFNNMMVIVKNAAGTVARRINDFANTNGAISVNALPFTPTVGDDVIILSRVSSRPGGGLTFGELVAALTVDWQ